LAFLNLAGLVGLLSTALETGFYFIRCRETKAGLVSSGRLNEEGAGKEGKCRKLHGRFRCERGVWMIMICNC
jgi:hypothetical protein